MIVDDISNAGKYLGLHPLFAAAFEYINTTDLTRVEEGTIVLQEGKLKAIFSDKPGKKRAASLEKFECHNQNIDIQVCISGTEEIGWKPRGTCAAPKAPYSDEKDVQFYNDAPDMFFTLKAGQFVIFFPEDVHAPMIGEGNIKKLVIKVKI